jgi:hypothetical protein
VLRKFAEMIIARADLDPGVGHADKRLFEIFVAEAGSAKHGTRRRAMSAVGKSVAARLESRIAHCKSLQWK